MFISSKWKKTTLEMALKLNHLLYPNLTIRCQKVENGSPDMFSKLLANLIG